MTRRKKRFVFNIALSLLGTFLPQYSIAQPFSKLVVFGDSGVDTGNVGIASPPVVGFSVPPSPPYYMSRFSNGPVWVDVLSDHLGLEKLQPSLAGGTNYAFGGATTGSIDNPFRDAGLLDMDDQVVGYLKDNTPAGDELFVLSGTSSFNDFSAGQTDPAEPIAYIGQIVSDLHAAGARNMLISNTIESLGGPTPDLLRLFNDLFTAEIAAQRIANPDLTIYEYNVDQAMNAILANPSAIGITNVNGQACGDCEAGFNPSPEDIAANPDSFLRFDMFHYTAPVQRFLGNAAFVKTQFRIDEDFDRIPAGELPKGTSPFDSSANREWGPGIVNINDGKIRFQTTGGVLPNDPEEPLKTGMMTLTWNESETDEAYANGYLRATVRADTASDANLTLRGNLETLSGYLFSGLGAHNGFRIFRFDGAEGQSLGEIDNLDFPLGTDWTIEAGAVDDVITMKVWPVGGPEPEFPQLVVIDDGLSSGLVGLAPAVSTAAISSPTQLDVTYDDVSFLPSVAGDVNVNSILDGGDIDRLSAAVASGEFHPFLDVNRDRILDETDRRGWVEELANTYFGDSNLDGQFDSSDLIQVMQSGEYEDGVAGNSRWAEGDWNGDGDFDSGDFVFAFKTGGYGLGPRAAMRAVPEPACVILVVIGFLSLCRFRNSR